MSQRAVGVLLAGAMSIVAIPPAYAQQLDGGIGASAIALATRDTHTPGNRSLVEGYLTQPILSGFVGTRWLSLLGTFNFEGLTLRRGELDLGEWGEGFVDRRHPHAYVHELMIGARSQREHSALSLYGGKGFVPFGSDDPMMRPFVSYPVDHHLAQILERLVVVAAAKMGPLVAETSLFNGDEPLDPSSAPRFDRFADSWSARGTLIGDSIAHGLRGLELSASWASVKSPEYQDGAGLDQRKGHAALRLTNDDGPFTRYGLIEAMQTTELDRGHPLYTFRALLAEAAVCHQELGAALRWERSDRPEEERLLDLFRSPRPATDVSILGVTRWTTLSVALALPAVQASGGHAAPFVEFAHLSVDRTTAALFDPVRFYGAATMWRLSAGVRFAAAHEHHQMGRYGAAARTEMTDGSHSHQMTHSPCFS